MVHPQQIIEEKPIPLGEVKDVLSNLKKSDKELNFLSNKTNEYLDAFISLSKEKKDNLKKSLHDLNLTRLKEEHIVKIIDFLPKNVSELKSVLQAYPLSMAKNDQEEILKVIKEAVG